VTRKAALYELERAREQLLFYIRCGHVVDDPDETHDDQVTKALGRVTSAIAILRNDDDTPKNSGKEVA
jgi:hypothetical protein